MRRSLIAAVLCATAVGLVPAAADAARPRVSATPKNVAFGQEQKISGHNWAVIEFCRPTVRVQLRSVQNVIDLGTARVRTNGTFTKRWTPRRARVGAGRWNVLITQRCESGKDGSTIFSRRATPIRIH